jgi:hypothetical protein
MTALLLTALLTTGAHADTPPSPEILTAIQEGQDVAFEFWYWKDHMYEVEFQREHDDDPNGTRITTWITFEAEDATPTGETTCIHGDGSCYDKENPSEDCFDCDGDGFAECDEGSDCRETYTFPWRDSCVPPGSVVYQIDRMDWKRLEVTDEGDPCLDEQDSASPEDSGVVKCGNSGCASAPGPVKLGLIAAMLALGAMLLRGSERD